MYNQNTYETLILRSIPLHSLLRAKSNSEISSEIEFKITFHSTLTAK